MRIGKAYGSTKIEVQECSSNRPPAKESIKAVSKNKPKKVLMSNIMCQQIGSLWLFRQETRPRLRSSLQKVKDQKSLARLKDRSKKCKKMLRIHYNYEVLDKICVLNAKTVITRKLLQAYYKDSC